MGGRLGGYLARFALPGTEATYTLGDPSSIRLISGARTFVPVTWLHPSDGTAMKPLVARDVAVRAIPLVHVLPAGNHAVSDRGAIVYAHGNGEDLGQVLAWAHQVADRFGRSVFVFDFEGYGLNRTRATERTIYDNIASVVTYLSSPPQNQRKMVLWGRSIGTAPAIYEAATVHTPGVIAGAVLQSAFRSVVTTYLPSRLIPRGCDIFLNERILADRCQVPVFLVHGTQDRVVPFSHGLALAKCAKIVWGHCWLDGAGHNDIESTPLYREQMLAAVGHFLASVSPPPEARAHELSRHLLIVGSPMPSARRECTRAIRRR